MSSHWLFRLVRIITLVGINCPLSLREMADIKAIEHPTLKVWCLCFNPWSWVTNCNVGHSMWYGILGPLWDPEQEVQSCSENTRPWGKSCHDGGHWTGQVLHLWRNFLKQNLSVDWWSSWEAVNHEKESKYCTDSFALWFSPWMLRQNAWCW